MPDTTPSQPGRRRAAASGSPPVADTHALLDRLTTSAAADGRDGAAPPDGRWAPDPPSPPDPQVVALARAVERTGRRVTDLDSQVRQLAAELLRVVAAFTPPSPDRGPDCESGGGEPPAVRSWLPVTNPEHAVRDLGDLVAWVGAVYVRYTHAPLSSCWRWHPDVVEELWWLRCAHAHAYHRTHGSWLRVGDWHDRQRPGVARRVTALLGTCSLSRHTDRDGCPAEVGEPPPPPLGGHHPGVAAAWTTTRTAGPAPTGALISEATQAEHAQHRGHR